MRTKHYILIALSLLFFISSCNFDSTSHATPVVSALTVAQLASSSALVVRNAPYSPETRHSSFGGSGTYYVLEGIPYIITANHVVKAFHMSIPAIAMSVSMQGWACFRPDERGYDLNELCVRMDFTNTLVGEPYDIVRVQLVNFLPALPAEVEIEYDWTIGETIWLSGAPAEDLSIHSACLTGSRGMGSVYTNGEAWPGSSGGGVWNEQGRLIGVIYAIRYGRPGWDLDFEAVEGNRTLTLIPRILTLP